jgi:hypothetical protein
MHTKNQILCFATLLLVAASFTSCKKKWKETTGMNLSFNYNPLSLPSGFSINSANINVNHFKFSGKRKQGGDVQFENNSQKGFNITTATSQQMNFEIPQGDYTSMIFDFTCARTDTMPFITVNGVFVDTNNVSSMVVVLISSSVYTSSIAKNGNGGTEITVTKSKQVSVNVVYNINYWLQTLNDNLFEEAEIESSNGVGTIIISKDKNVPIYQAIINRLNIPPTVTVN